MSRYAPRGSSPEEKLRFYGWYVTESGCWEWLGRTQSKGYGVLRVSSGNALTHRLAYDVWVDPIPVGLLVRHKCDNPPCINPDHLEVGTYADNMRDKVERGRSNSVRGVHAGLAKLTDVKVREIRYLWSTGDFLQRDIAKMYGVSASAIGQVVVRKSWKHVA